MRFYERRPADAPSYPISPSTIKRGDMPDSDFDRCHWHVTDDGIVQIYQSGKLLLEIKMRPDMLSAFAADCWRAAAKQARAG